MQLYKHQKEILEEPRTKLVLAYDTGTGKTLTALTLAKKHDVKCLIVVPKSIKQKWVDIAEDHVVVTKEYFRDHVEEMVSLNLDGLIIDEAHFFAGITSSMTKSLKAYNDRVEPTYRWYLTATPYLSTPWNVYVLAMHTGMNPNYIKFRNMFFVQIRMGTRVIWNAKSGTDELLNYMLSKFTIWADFEDVARDNGIEYDTSSQTKEVITLQQSVDSIEAELSLQETGIALWTKRHTIQNGFYENEYEGVAYYEDVKMDYIVKVAKKQPKLAIVCRYHRQIDRYYNKLTSLGYSVEIIKGGIKNIEDFAKELDKRERVIVIIQANISEGYEMPTFPYVIIASLSFAYKDYKQIQGRFLRVNKITKTHIDILLINKGVDIDVYKAVSNKQNFYLKNLINK